MTTVDRSRQEPTVLACGCLAQLVRNTAHACDRFSGARADSYPWIIVWGAYLGSTADFIQGQIDRARADHAPLDAYRELLGDGGAHTGRWATVEQISTLTRTRIGLRPLPEREG